MADEVRVLRGRRVIVTGASSGIGAAIARSAAEAGASVGLVARRSGPLEAVAAELDGTWRSADVAEPGAAKVAVEELADELGGIDALINNAGRMDRGSPSATDPEAWRAAYEVNVLGLLATTHAAVPHLRRSAHPNIINISSMSGRRVAGAASGVYASTKFAVHALGEALRMELQPEGIAVTTVSPGLVRTNLADGLDDEHRREWQRKAEERGLDPEVLGEVVRHLLSLPPGVCPVEYALTATAQVPGG
ncbi:MAG: SDR family oxidoreductase [Microthrixaceae bacterium]|nr:SDR family oxidoreductase [Microthrixaceae bacterium]